jgi:hypothetical protein
MLNPKIEDEERNVLLRAWNVRRKAHCTVHPQGIYPTSYSPLRDCPFFFNFCFRFVGPK